MTDPRIPVSQTLDDRRAQVRRERKDRSLAGELDEIALRCARLPVLDDRETDEILGYDENGTT